MSLLEYANFSRIKSLLEWAPVVYYVGNIKKNNNNNKKACKMFVTAASQSSKKKVPKNACYPEKPLLSEFDGATYAYCSFIGSKYFIILLLQMLKLTDLW